MLDTIRLKCVPLTPGLIDSLKQKGLVTKKYRYNDLLMVFGNVIIDLPSHNYNINIFLRNTDFIIEFSIPKFFYNNNIVMSFHTKQDIFFSINKLISSFLGYKVEFDIEILRLDLSYNFKMGDYSQAEKYLSIIKNDDISRKKKYIYDTSCAFVSPSSTYKWYLKKPEFMAHDYKRIYKNSPNFALSLLDYSSSILRFEVSIRKRAGVDFDRALCYPQEYLSFFLARFRINDKRIKYKTLCAVMKKPTSQQLSALGFFYANSHPDESVRLLTKNIERTSKYRYKKIIAELGIAITNKIEPLSIPHPASVEQSRATADALNHYLMRV